MATITAAATGNWSAGGTWNGGVKPGVNDVGDANGFNVTLDEDITVQGIQATTGTFIVPAATTRTITGNVTYSGTSAGMIAIATGQALVVNGTVSLTGAGYCIAGSGIGTLTVTNAGGTAISCGSAGRTVSWPGTGAVTITGAVTGTSSGMGVYIAGAATVQITGAVSQSSTGYAVCVGGNSAVVTITGAVTSTGAFGYGVYINITATVTINGALIGPGITVHVGAGTVTWSSASARTIAAGASATVLLTGGTFDINGVTLNNSGNFCIVNAGGTVTCAGAIIQNQTHLAGAADTSGTINPIVRPFRSPVMGGRLMRAA